MKFKGLKFLSYLVALIIVSFVFILNNPTIFDGFKKVDNYSTTVVSKDKINKDLMSQSIDELISQISIEQGKESKYDRNEYTSQTQSYTYKGKNIKSIRNYSYYASVNYDDKTDKYLDPYSGKYLTNVKQADYDHIIPLHYANQHGADKWSDEKKKEYADDPTVGVCVSAHANRSKGDKGPAKYMPEVNKADYAYTWLVLSVKYNLSMSKEDMSVVKQELKGKTKEQVKLINEYKNN